MLSLKESGHKLRARVHCHATRGRWQRSGMQACHCLKWPFSSAPRTHTNAELALQTKMRLSLPAKSWDMAFVRTLHCAIAGPLQQTQTHTDMRPRHLTCTYDLPGRAGIWYMHGQPIPGRQGYGLCQPVEMSRQCM